MPDIHFSFCPFNEDLIAKVLDEQPHEKSVFIFPNESSKRVALKKFQPQWEFDFTLFITMAEFKENLFLPGKPLLKEEKRTLAFYASLKDEDKDFFKITNYFQSIELAGNFFSLWEEFNEENVDENLERSIFINNDADFLGWQLETYEYLLKIKKQYQGHIHRIGFDDSIFIHKKEKINIFSLDDFNRFIFVNQFYYTNFEKSIIETLQQHNKTIVIYYQLPQQIVDKDNLTIRPFTLKNLLQNYRTHQIIITESKNDFSMIMALLQQTAESNIKNIIDISFQKNPYSRFLSVAEFNIGYTTSFSSSSIYRFFTVLYQLLDSMLWEPERKKVLVPLQNILNSLLTEDFIFYFLKDQSPQTRKQTHEQALKYVYSLIDYEIKYLDLDDRNLSHLPKSPAVNILQTITGFVHKFAHINNIKDLIARLDSESDGVNIKKIISDREFRYSNILDVFFSLLADFMSIEEVGIVQDWDQYFNISNPYLKKLKTASGILRLFIDYMKPKHFHFQYETEGSRCEITSLQDTRNISFNNVAVLNVTEGKIPTGRIIPFLFTDKQRKLMNLKTYDDIKLREKYYFFRLVLSAGKVYLFTQKNTEKNIEISSFIEELLLYFPRQVLLLNDTKDLLYGNIYRYIMDCKDYRPKKKITQNPAFYRFALDKKTEFADDCIKLTYSSYKDLVNNPFVYYIKHIAELNECPKLVENDFSPRLIGNIVHDIINEAWSFLQQQKSPLLGYDFSQINKDYIIRAIHKTIGRPKYYYTILHDHTFIYFDTIIVQNITDGITGFFRFLDDLHLSFKELEILPETEYSSGDEKIYKTLFSQTENDLNLKVQIRGRADLRIHVPGDNKHLIFDYKTGNYEKEQLILYELFYYLIDHPEKAEYVDSYFYQILKKQSQGLRDYYKTGQKSKTKSEILQSFKYGFLHILNGLSQSGYCLPEQKSKLNDFAEITRKDLFLAKAGLNSNTIKV
ncbi:PD-(D/E)XK nuclease family protein [candidate division KSB1 bacterium]|nr:PD-(D/E)XK nuclease family protein [candidate division KSB1 bacterium]